MASRAFLRSIKNAKSLIKPNGLTQGLTKQIKLNLNSNLLISNRAFSTTMFKSTNVLKDLSNFLNEEIKLETEARKNRSELPKVTGFNVKTEGPNVTLTKKYNDEDITITFNVNGSLDNGEPNIDQAIENEKNDQPPAELKSRPTFTVEVKKGEQVLAFGCSYLPAEEGEKDVVEDFQIDEFTIHTGDWNENVYTADCSVLDENLYDLLLNLLDERGVGEKFANELAEFSTSYEHHQYIGLLEKLRNFTK